MRNDALGTVGSVDKALQILLLLGERERLRVIEVADHFGIARSTAHRLLSAMVQRGFAVQDAHKVYHRGPGFIRAGLAGESAPALRIAVRPSLEELHREVGETCHLVMLEGNGARFVDGVESGQVLRVGSRIGMLLPAHSTSAGKALLAELSSADFFALYPRGLPGARADLARRAALQRQLAVVRKRGYATNFGESEPGVTAVGVCIKNSVGRAVAAMAVACPNARCPRSQVEELVGPLRHACATAQHALARY